MISRPGRSWGGTTVIEEGTLPAIGASLRASKRLCRRRRALTWSLDGVCPRRLRHAHPFFQFYGRSRRSVDPYRICVGVGDARDLPDSFAVPWCPNGRGQHRTPHRVPENFGFAVPTVPQVVIPAVLPRHRRMRIGLGVACSCRGRRMIARRSVSVPVIDCAIRDATTGDRGRSSRMIVLLLDAPCGPQGLSRFKWRNAHQDESGTSPGLTTKRAPSTSSRDEFTIAAGRSSPSSGPPDAARPR